MHAIDELLEQRRVGTTEEALSGGRTVGATDVEVVHGRERRELALTETVTAMMIQRQLAVTPLHGRAAALEQIGAFAGYLLDTLSDGRGECLLSPLPRSSALTH